MFPLSEIAGEVDSGETKASYLSPPTHRPSTMPAGKDKKKEWPVPPLLQNPNDYDINGAADEVLEMRSNLHWFERVVQSRDTNPAAFASLMEKLVRLLRCRLRVH